MIKSCCRYKNKHLSGIWIIYFYFNPAIVPYKKHNFLIMRYLLILASFFCTSFLYAQTESKPPKLRIEHSFFSTRYELGDKTTPHKDVALHLKKHEPDAYIKWKAADRASINGLLWSIVGLGGIVVGVASSESETQLAGYTVGAIGFGMVLITDFSEKAKRQRAIDIYNTKFGY